MIAPIVPSSPSSISGSEYSQSSSIPWSRDSFGTQPTDLDLGDIYDVSSDEEDSRKRKLRAGLTRAASRSSINSRLSGGSLVGKQVLPTLIIPAERQTGSSAYKFKSPIPPTPPPKVAMSPAVLQYLSAQEVLSTSATPSLDGSLSSEQLAAMSAPPTPDVGGNDSDIDHWGGIQLQPNAMATLQSLSYDEVFEQQSEQVIEISQETDPTREMQQSPPPINTNIRRHNSVVLSPTSQQSLNSLSKLEIPSPGGFFSSLSPGTRTTWHLVPLEPPSAVPPSSTTAEHFYKTPWSAPDAVEHIVEVSEVDDDGCPTARPVFNERLTSPEPSTEEDVTEMLADYSADYLQRLKLEATTNLDRTGHWLTAQFSYLHSLNLTQEHEEEAVTEEKEKETALETLERAASPAKKTVRFSALNEIKEIKCVLPAIKRQESAYHRSFRLTVTRSRYRDIYVHRLPRFEALQAQRVALPAQHRNQLLGKYQLSVVPMSEKEKRKSANVARGDDTIEENLDRLRQDKEYEAMDQMRVATWNVMAAKMLNGGRLIGAPVAKKLFRLSQMGPKPDGTPRDRARILDLGGQATCDWAWHCATEYPNTKVYTVTTKAMRQLSNSNIRGPKNHRQVAVEKLTRLPFRNNFFDVISARNVYSILKMSSEHGIDEYDVCLQECMRCLKPGGYLEFSLLDSDIINAGPLGQAKSVEFGFTLKQRGYDPTPTKSWLGRLNKAGFVNVKRAWVFLPMGAPLPSYPVTRDSMGVQQPLELEAMVQGSTAAAASITGLVGSWAWEKWMLKLEVETGKKEDCCVEGVYEIVEEGRRCGAGWRTLNGWARKPVA